ncbi:hypothetical protein BDR26DRAFT_874166 [Obelidium mucronatum]|nr:hypothetical protein BDR26DRAFT_874166 [Obelidium mucronatum]
MASPITTDFSTASRFKPAASQRTVRQHLTKSSIVVAYDESSNKLHVVPCAPNLSALDILSTTHNAILKCFQSTRCHPHRFIYCTAGRLFFAGAPLPFGGPRINPGFTEFRGVDAEELLAFIVASAYKVYWNLRGRGGLDAVVEAVGCVLDWHAKGLKDHLDELCLKGMKKAGHIEWFGPADVPKHLRNYFEEGVADKGVLFTPIRLSLEVQ